MPTPDQLVEKPSQEDVHNSRGEASTQTLRRSCSLERSVHTTETAQNKQKTHLYDACSEILGRNVHGL